MPDWVARLTQQLEPALAAIDPQSRNQRLSRYAVRDLSLPTRGGV